MTALAMERMRAFERWTYHRFTLASGKKGWKHGAAGINLATGKVEPAAAAAALFIIGIFDETVDATAADKVVNVNLCREIEVEWWANSGDVVAASVGNICYFADDNTVTLVENDCVAGRVWAVDAANGVAVEKLQTPPVAVGP